MKKFKCPNCHNEKEVDDNIIMVSCGCGYFMDEIIIPKNIMEIKK